MKLRQSAAPFFRLTGAPRDIMLSQLLACCALLCAGVVLHGIRALVMALFGILGAVLIEVVWRFSLNSQQNLTDLADLVAPVTGLLCALAMPANASVWLPFFAALFAVGMVRLPFGGELGRSPFNASAAGICFAATVGASLKQVSSSARMSAVERALYDKLPEHCFAYIKGYHPVFSSPATNPSVVSDYLSPTMLLRAGVDPCCKGSSIFWGSYNGAMGATFALLIVLCAVWLVLRRSIAWHASLSFAATVLVLSFLFPWQPVSRWMSPIYDIAASPVMFAAVFLIGDLFTAPHIRSARYVYGAAGGILAFILRRTGSIELGEVFAVLIMNALSDQLDRLAWHLRSSGFSINKWLRKQKARIRKKLNLNNNPIDDLEALEAARLGESGDISQLGRKAGDGGNEKI